MYSILPLEPNFWEVLDSFVLLAYTIFAASRTLMQWLLACLNFIWSSIDRSVLLIQTKKVISMNYGSSTNSSEPWRRVRLDLIFMMRHIYIKSNLNPLTVFTSTSRRIELKDIIPWNISRIITKTIPISTKLVISYTMKQDI